jgi:hypothetical protein
VRGTSGARLETVDSNDVTEFFERVSDQWEDMRSSFYNADVIESLAEYRCASLGMP